MSKKLNIIDIWHPELKTTDDFVNSFIKGDISIFEGKIGFLLYPLSNELEKHYYSCLQRMVEESKGLIIAIDFEYQLTRLKTVAKTKTFPEFYDELLGCLFYMSGKYYSEVMTIKNEKNNSCGDMLIITNFKASDKDLKKIVEWFVERLKKVPAVTPGEGKLTEKED